MYLSKKYRLTVNLIAPGSCLSTNQPLLVQVKATKTASQWPQGQVRRGLYLVNLLPALEVLSTNGRVVMEQHLAEDHVRGLHHAQVERGQALRVLVVGAGAKLK